MLLLVILQNNKNARYMYWNIAFNLVSASPRVSFSSRLTTASCSTVRLKAGLCELRPEIRTLKNIAMKYLKAFFFFSGSWQNFRWLYCLAFKLVLAGKKSLDTLFQSAVTLCGDCFVWMETSSEGLHRHLTVSNNMSVERNGYITNFWSTVQSNFLLF